MYTLAGNTVSGLAPDVIVVQDSCRICAVSPGAITCLPLSIKQVVLFPKTLPDVLANIVEVAASLGHEQKGVDYVASLQMRLDRLPAPNAVGMLPGVLVLEWIDPLMSCGYWIPEIIAYGGGRCVPPIAPGAHTGYISIFEIMAAEPQHVFIAACGFDILRCAQEVVKASEASRVALRRILDSGGHSCTALSRTYTIHALPLSLARALSPAHTLAHAHHSHTLCQLAGVAVWVADGNRFFNRSGPYVVESAVMVAQVRCRDSHIPYGFTHTIWIYT